MAKKLKVERVIATDLMPTWLAWSKHWLAHGTADKASIEVRDGVTGESRYRRSFASNVCAAWRGDVLAVAAADVFLWEVATGATTIVQSRKASFVAWSPASDKLLTNAGKRVSIYGGPRWGAIADHDASDYVYDGAWIDQESFVAGHADGLTVFRNGNVSPSESRGAPHAICVATSVQGLIAVDEGTSVVVDSAAGNRVVLEHHEWTIQALAFSGDGSLLASRDTEGNIAIWRTADWQLLHTVKEFSTTEHFYCIKFHPEEPLLAASGKRGIHIYRVPAAGVLGVATKPSVHYTTAKIALVGDSGVGKTGLGWRLAHGSFRDHPSTHGEQFWVVDRLSAKRADGTECEAVIWDLAGQPDYRLIHSLFLDDADVALVVFDPTNRQEPLKGVEFWLRALMPAGERRCRTILVGGRVDRGIGVYTEEEIDAFAEKWSIAGGYIPTSALRGEGIDLLFDRIVQLIEWDKRTATVTTETFKAIKDHVLAIKEDPAFTAVLVTPAELQASLEQRTGTRYDVADIVAATQHLGNHGYVRHLRDSTGARFILLAPDLLNNLASSIVLEARRNPKGLGALNERELLSGTYSFPELTPLQTRDREILLDAAAILFIGHNICFRETLGRDTFLIFPSLINQNKPPLEDAAVIDGTAYTVSGATENVYASLVVLLGYTTTFTRTNQWRHHAQYEMGDERELCGFRLSEEREGEIDLVLYFGEQAGPLTRQLFQALFEKFLLTRHVQVQAFPPVTCAKCGYAQPRTEVIKRQRKVEKSMFCTECGKRVPLPPAVLTTPSREAPPETVDREQQTVRQRTHFEKAVTWLKGYLRDRGEAKAPVCFISYAWGDPAHERWIERQLATDLRNAGIDVLLDRWHSTPGASITRYVEQIATADFVVVAGTKRLRKKYDAKKTDAVVEAELRMINTRVRKKSESERVVPLLIEGEAAASFPPLLEDSVFVDFRDPDLYFERLFDLLLKLYAIPFDEPAMRDLRDTIRGDQRKR